MPYPETLVNRRAHFFKRNAAEKPFAAIVAKVFDATEVRLVIFTPEGKVMESPPDRVTVVAAADYDINNPDLPDNCCVILD